MAWDLMECIRHSIDEGGGQMGCGSRLISKVYHYSICRAQSTGFEGHAQHIDAGPSEDQEAS